MTTLAELAKLVGGEVVGDPELKINGVSGIEDAQAGTITLVASAKLLPTARESGLPPLSCPTPFRTSGARGLR